MSIKTKIKFQQKIKLSDQLAILFINVLPTGT